MSDGRADMVVKYRSHVYVCEFKAVDDTPTGEATAQTIARGYADAYRVQERPIHLVAVEFGRKTQNIADFQAKTVLWGVGGRGKRKKNFSASKG